MKRILFFVLAIALIAMSSMSALEATIIDFTTLDADILPATNADGSAGEPQQHRRTTMDYSIAAGASFTQDQKNLMRSSLALPNWEIVLNTSAKSPVAVANSYVKSAPVKNEETVPEQVRGKNVMGVRIFFPEGPYNANAIIKPPFEIPAYEPLRARDDNGNVQQQTAEEKAKGITNFERDSQAGDVAAYGVVKNVGTIKSLQVTVFGDQYPNVLYVILKDTDGVEHRYYMGSLKFDGWKEIIWNNPHYLTDARAREIRVYPVYPRGIPFVKFVGFQVTRNGETYDSKQAFSSEFISYFKDVKIIYDKAVLNTDRDIVEEDLWGIVQKKEDAKQNAEIERFGIKQVDRYVEKVNMATEAGFSSSLNPPAQQ
ncbi:MAG: flagellar filament outer layer protein FlaA [Treponemataceae bacterium]|nr:MAG: flagellar filament outer layer protein FlaA [Treponemataceae bacterium]